MIIYKVISLINGKIYIGKDVSNRQNYYGSGIYIKRAISKYGIKNFKKEILEHCKTKEQLNEREKYWIKKLNSKVPNGYNIIDGGTGGDLFSQLSEKSKKITRQKISKTNKRLKSHKLNCQCCYCKTMRHEPLSKETKQKLRKPKSEETKQKISSANKGKILGSQTKQHRENISQANKGKIRTKKKRENISMGLAVWWRKRKQLQGV